MSGSGLSGSLNRSSLSGGLRVPWFRIIREAAVSETDRGDFCTEPGDLPPSPHLGISTISQ